MQMQNNKSSGFAAARVRPLQKPDLLEAKRIFHLAFGTFLGLPDPMQFCADRDFLSGRYRAHSESALAAEVDGEIVGSNIVTNWGSVGFFGPLTVRPDFWDRGVATRLLERTMEIFEQWQTRHAGLFTFAQSPKHVHLYQKFGFRPRFLTAVMSAAVRPAKDCAMHLYSELSPDEQKEFLKASRELTEAIYAELDLRNEIRTVAEQRLGDTVFVWDGSRLASFAVCHCGSGTEAGDGTCYVKFGAARRGPAFDRLLDACEALASGRGLARLEAGVNLARHDAYERMLTRGFRTAIQGIAMHKPNEPGYCRPDACVLDDWR